MTLKLDGSKKFPDTTEENAEEYLAGEAPKALLNGESLEYSRHVIEWEYDISPDVRSCFVRGKGIPHERTNNAPYEPWVLLIKDGSVMTGECSFVAG